MTLKRFVAYLRVNKDQEDIYDDVLNDQKSKVHNYMIENVGEVVGEFIELEQGRNFDRGELQKAIQQCHMDAVDLVIGKVGKLALSVNFLTQIKDGAIDFCCCDNPSLDKDSLLEFLQKAEQNRQRISSRTKEGLQRAKSRGVKLGNSELGDVRSTDLRSANAQIQKNADDFANIMKEILHKMYLEDGFTNPHDIAEVLNQNGVTARRGGKWSVSQVKRIIRRLSSK